MSAISRVLSLPVMAICILCAGCIDSSQVTSRYIETEKGIFPYSGGYCQLGMLLNNDLDNIMDENNKPITCSGYVKLTDAEAAAHGYKGKI